MSEGDQFLCFFAGANSLFLGDRLLTAENPPLSQDRDMLQRMGFSLTKPFEAEIRA